VHPHCVVVLQHWDARRQAGQSDLTHVHVPPLHCRLLVQANAEPQPPQLLLLVLKSIQAPLQRL
jgi:hypothetical protein